MRHAYHGDLKGIILFDGCDECETRATRLWEMDIYTLRAIAALDKFEIANNGTGGASHADRKALETLELYARIVDASGILEEDK